MGLANTVFNLNVGGNIIVGKDKDTNGGGLDLGPSSSNTTTDWGGPLDTLTVGKDIIVYNSSTLSMNVYNRKGTSSYYDPDVLIGGLIQGVGSGSPNYINPTINFFNINPYELTSNISSIVSVEGITGGVLQGDQITSIPRYLLHLFYTCVRKRGIHTVLTAGYLIQ